MKQSDMTDNSVVLPIGMESKIHVRIFPANSIRFTKQPETLNPTPEERKTVIKPMTFQFETINYPPETEFRFLWSVNREGKNPYTIPNREKVTITTIREWTEQEGKKQCALREFTINCDFVTLGLFGKGKLLLEIVPDYQYGERPIAEFPFDYPFDLSFIIPGRKAPLIGTEVTLHPECSDLYEACKLRLEISECPNKVGKGKQREANSLRKNWEPGQLNRTKTWNIGCETCDSIIQQITWPEQGETTFFLYEYKVTVISPDRERNHLLQNWTPLEYKTEKERAETKRLEVEKPRLRKFSLEIEEITKPKEPFEKDENALIPPHRDPKWKTFRFLPTIQVEGINPALSLPMLIDYRYLSKRGMKVRGNRSTPIRDPFPFYLEGSANPIHELSLAVEDEVEESRFLVALSFPNWLFTDEKQKPFENVLGYWNEQWIPWGEMIDDPETLQLRATVQSLAMGVALQTSAEETANQRAEAAKDISDISWKNEEGETIYNANVDDPVKLTAKFKKLKEGTPLQVTIYEQDETGNNDFIKNFETTVQNGAMELDWNVIYTEDLDDTESDRETEQKGYTLPEYLFIIRQEEQKIEVESDLLEINGWIKMLLQHEETEECFKNVGYALLYPDGTEETGVSDAEGYIFVKEKWIGNYKADTIDPINSDIELPDDIKLPDDIDLSDDDIDLLFDEDCNQLVDTTEDEE